MNEGMNMTEMYRIRYEGRGDHENVIGVSTHFSETEEEAMIMTRKWIDLAFGEASEFDLFNDGPTFKG